MTQLREPHVSDDNAITVFPFYLVVDVSYSMSNEMAALNQALREFRDGLKAEPLLRDITHFGLIEFSDSARVVVPLGDFSAVDMTKQVLAPQGGTSYGAAFEKLRTVIDRDIDALKATAARDSEPVRYFRPAAFFLTDGCPTDSGWERSFAKLTAAKRYPLVVPFGFGTADVALLRRIAHPADRSKVYMARDGANVASVLKEMLDIILQSVVNSSNSAINGERPAHILPAQNQVSSNIEVYPGGDFV